MSRLHAELFVAQLEVEVIAAEAKAGVNVKHAIRALYPHEVKATTRFGELEDETSKTVGRVKQIVDGLWASLGLWLSGDLVDHADDGAQLARRIHELRDNAGSLPAAQRAIVAAAASEIGKALLDIRMTWARLTRDEAIRQGVAKSSLPDLRQLRPSPSVLDYLHLQAQLVAGHPRRRMLDVAAGAVGGVNLVEADPAGLLDLIADAVAKTPHDGSVDLGRQAVYSSGSTGRWAVATGAPKPKFVYASELLDGKTCGPCAAMDGREWESIEEAEEEYPPGGGYRHCEGGRRCRGTPVFVWDDEVDPTIDAAPPPVDGGPDTYPDPAKLPFTSGDMTKVIEGAERAGSWSGGHAFDAKHAERFFGTAKRCFPRAWTRDQIEDAVTAAARSPQWRGAVLGPRGDARITHATVVDNVLVVAIWQYRPDGVHFFAAYPENGFGVIMRNRKGNPGQLHGLDLSALDKYGIR